MSPKRQRTGGQGKKSVEWYTPWWLIRQLEQEFGVFALDPCAKDETVAKAKRFFTPEEDGLLQRWTPGPVFVNPPYGDGVIGQWIEKARTESQLERVTVVCLVPAYTDSDWFQDQVLGKAEVRYLRGRIRFAGPEGVRNDAPFGSALVIYRPQ